jgi:hypothetical protein
VKKIFLIPISLILLLSLLIPSLHAKRSDGDTIIPKIEPRAPATAAKHTSDPQRSATALPDTFILGEWTFDAPGGGPDPQGWTSFDKTEQTDVYFHVDDFAGLGGGNSGNLLPIHGLQSLWCGASPGPIEFCNYATLPGYGNIWDQYFESVDFNHSGDVTMAFEAYYDSEPGYDYTHVQYQNKHDEWVTIISLHGDGSLVVNDTIPSDSLDGNVKFRFWFTSDGAWSDEDGSWDTDGAVIIDSLTVSDTTGTLDYQDFESESVGDLSTTDGDWVAVFDPAFGDYSGLFDGTTVLQEDTNWTNTTYLWGFFNGSTDTYECGGHPEQLVIPYTQNPGSNNMNDYLHNEIWSPWIDLKYDINGMPVPWDATGLLYEFDVYRDLPLTSVQYYTFRIRSLVNDCPTYWRKYDEFWYGPGKDWYHWEAEYGHLVENEATHVQLALSAADWCSILCDTYGGDCHTHAPLFDNVKLSRIFYGGTGVEETPAVETALHQCYPNPFNPLTTIAFSIREQAHVSLKVYNAAGQHVATLLYETRDAGMHTDVKWDGRNALGAPVSSGVYFYQLVTGDYSQTKKMVLIK